MVAFKFWMHVLKYDFELTCGFGGSSPWHFDFVTEAGLQVRLDLSELGFVPSSATEKKVALVRIIETGRRLVTPFKSFTSNPAWLIDSYYIFHQTLTNTRYESAKASWWWLWVLISQSTPVNWLGCFVIFKAGFLRLPRRRNTMFQLLPKYASSTKQCDV